MIAREPDTARLLAHYDQPGPRYTSYPTAVEFHDGFGEHQYRDVAQVGEQSLDFSG